VIFTKTVIIGIFLIFTIGNSFSSIFALSEETGDSSGGGNVVIEIILSPLKQFKLGIPIDEITCKERLELVIKLSDDSPACVTHSTFEILKQRGWIAHLVSNSNTKPVINPPEIKEQAKNIVDANNQFMIDYYSITSTDEDNSFFSPWSLLSAFSVLYEGVRGQTADEISRVFYLPTDDSARRDSFGTMQNNLNVNGSGYELRNANALWIQQGFGIKEDFINISKQYYDSKVSEVNFPADEPIIDSWVEEKTNNKIKDLIKGKTDDSTRLVITNAIYFKGTWQTEFEPNQTQDSQFRVNEDKSVSVPMMNIQSEFPYAETGDLQILSLPYKGQRMSMLVLLPKDNLESIEKSITVEKLEYWKKSLQEQEIRLFMPKFKLETTYELPEIMKNLGMKLAFDGDNADLSGIANIPPRLFVTAAVHKAFVEVNEEGTEAAAATGIDVSVTSLGPELPVFRADHPFVFLIQDNETGLILFIGKVADPTK
jgi:serpin B